MTLFITKPVSMDIPEACLRFVALTFDAPKYYCRIRKCRRNRICSGDAIPSDGRLEASASTLGVAIPWPDSARIPPCHLTMEDYRIERLAMSLPMIYDSMTYRCAPETNIHHLLKITRPKYLKDFPRDWPKKPA